MPRFFNLHWPRPRRLEAGQQPIVFFDGVCGLCNHFVQFLFDKDSSAVFKVATLQGDLGKTLGIDSKNLTTIIVKTHDNRLLMRSAAVIYVLKSLGGIWAVLGVLSSAAPAPARDLVYNGIARYRYRAFGKLPACRLPTIEEQSRYLN